MRLKVLVIDPVASSSQSVASAVRSLDDFEVFTSASGPAGIDRVRREGIDIVLLDAGLKDPSSFELIETLRAIRPEPEIILTTDQARVEDAVRAVRLGAADYISRQDGATPLAVALDRARRIRALVRENTQLRQELRDRAEERRLIGKTDGMERLHDQIDLLAKGDSPVLIVGEAGTGKELVARAIHADSARAAEPFVRVRVVGARREDAAREFVSATGRVAGGTLFIDEVSALPAELQESLAQRPPDRARLVASSERNLLELVGRGLFRQDLFERLSRSVISVPALRERRDDLPALVREILRRRREKGMRTAETAAPDALAALMAHSWPGNVRELEQAVGRACELGDGRTLERRNLPPTVIAAQQAERHGETETAGTQSLREMESVIIRRFLEEQQGNTEVVARLLKIDRSTLYRKIKRYGIDLDRLRGVP